jgi:hypothetical protein
MTTTPTSSLTPTLEPWPLPTPANDVADVPYTWKQLPIGGGGFVTGMVIHPTTPGLVYANTDVGGAYRWDEATRSWSQLLRSDRVTGSPRGDFEVESIAISVSNDQIVCLAAGNGEGGRILKSADRGEHWVETGCGDRWFIQGNGDIRTGSQRLAVDPLNEEIVYFGSRRAGLWVSEDGAATWRQIPAERVPIGLGRAESPTGVKWVLFDPTGGADEGRTLRIYAGVAGAGIYRSRDAGQTWDEIFKIDAFGKIPFAAKLDPSGLLYATLDEHLQVFDPAVETWRILKRNVSSWANFAIDPFNPRRIFLTDGAVRDGHFFRSLDGGETWQTLNISYGELDPAWIGQTDAINWLSTGDLVFDPLQPGLLWFAEGMGMWQTRDLDDDVVAWNFISRGIEELVTADVLAPPGGFLVTSAMDRQGFAFPDLTKSPASPLAGEFYTGSSLDYSGGSPNVLVVALAHTNYDVNAGSAAISTDRGLTWNYLPTLPPYNGGGNIAISASDPNNIVWLPSGDLENAAHRKPYYTLDGGQSWTQAPGFEHISKLHLLAWWVTHRALDSDKVDGGVFYIIAADPELRDRFFVTRDGGQSWQAAPHSPPCLEAYDCHVWGQLRATPGFAGHVWVSTSKNGLWYTSDAGQTPWVQVADVERAETFGFGAPLSGQTYPALYLDGILRGEHGYWRSADSGVTWQKIATYPGGYYSAVMAISGDMNVPGRVYIGLEGNSYLYGDPQP